MANFFKGFSKTTLAFLLIGIGVVVIVAKDPPRTVCDTQIREFRFRQRGFVYPDPKQPMKRSTGFVDKGKSCKIETTPGACYPLFFAVKGLLNDIETVNSECVAPVARLKAVQTAITKTLELMVGLAWRQNQQQQWGAASGWFDAADLNLFCRLRSRYRDSYGIPAWSAFREKYMTNNLPEADKLPGHESFRGVRPEIWKNILFVYGRQCTKYL